MSSTVVNINTCQFYYQSQPSRNDVSVCLIFINPSAAEDRIVQEIEANTNPADIMHQQPWYLLSRINRGLVQYKDALLPV